MSKENLKLWTVGQIDATGVRGPHEVELENISKNKYPLFTHILCESHRRSPGISNNFIVKE